MSWGATSSSGYYSAEPTVLHTAPAKCDLARNAVAGASLDEEFTGGRGRVLSLRWVYTHMIEEYARHNGHADLLRQRIDGTTGS